MNKIAKEILNTLDKKGYEAYIVGGYVRDCLLGSESNDIDICTSAKMKDVVSMFHGKVNDYGSLNLKINDYNIDITTYRIDGDYLNRRPTNISYTKLLDVDLQRRDFTINTICMDKNGKVIDKLNGINDLNKGIIRMVGNTEEKIKEDPLRILRAIRFCTILDFTLDEELEKEIIKNKELVKSLSTYRIKEELSKILLSSNYNIGLDFIHNNGLDKLLGISYNNIIYTRDVCGMWAQINFINDLPFTKNEKNTILKIKEILSLGIISNETLYKYGLYLCLIAGEILGISSSSIHNMYNNLPIYLNKDLKINYQDILSILNLKPSKLASLIENDIITEVLNGRIENDYDVLKEYIIKNKERWIKNE
jgi:tRNA nucleotidyltransferase (CCA-adding enzyme)